MAYIERKNGKYESKTLYTPGHHTEDLYLCYCGTQNCTPDHSFGPVARDEYLIHFVISGRGFFQIHGREYPLSRGQAFLIPSQVTTYYYADPTFPYTYAWIAFNGKKADSFLSQTILSSYHPVCDLPFPAEHFLDMIQQILSCKELDVESDLHRTGLLYEILSFLVKDTPAIHPPVSEYLPETYIRHALQFIEHSYSRINVSDISNYVGVNRSYLYSLFKKELHISPQEYLVDYRLKKARDLLSETALPITDIAAATGYSDPLNFSKAFKKKFGCSPATYRSSQSTAPESPRKGEIQ